MRFQCKKYLTSSLALTISVGLFASAQTMAFEPFHEDDQNTITIFRSGDENSRHFEVNGKHFSWNDLSEEQKQKIRILEKEMDAAELAFEASESHLEAMAEELEARADQLAISSEALIEFDDVVVFEPNETNDNISVEDLEAIAAQMEKNARQIRQAMRSKAVEMREIEEKLRHLDSVDTSKIDRAARKMEMALIEIAETVD